MQRGPDLKFWSGVGLALVSLAPGISDAIRTILALIGGALIVVSIVFAIVRRPSPAPSPSGPRRTDWEEQLHEHRLDRREFNRLLKAAFANWSMKPTGDRSLEDIARGSQIPTDLPLTDNSKFPHWAWAAEERCTGDAAILLQFASAIYPAVTPPMAVKSQLMGSTGEFDRFDTIRIELAKFWDYWGRQVPIDRVITEQKGDPIVRAFASEIKLLTFLEIARVRWADSGLPGKSGLFRLGRRNAEMDA